MPGYAPHLARSQKIIDLYCRISLDTDGQGGYRSVDDQETDGRFRVAEAGHTVGMVWKDPAKSAWNPNVVRKDFEKMMARLEAGESDGFWVYDLTRFSRKPIEGERVIAMAERGLIILSNDGEYDLMTADGIKHFRDDLNDAAHESNKISKRTRRGKKKKAMVRGRSNASTRGYGCPGYAPPPPGWAKGDPRPTVPPEQVEAEREELRKAAKWLLAGVPFDHIIADMNERGLRTVTGLEWTPSSLRTVLVRPSTGGLVEYKDEIVPGKTLPEGGALDLDTWQRVTALFAARRRGRPATEYLLSGLWRCTLCGGPLYGRQLKQMKPYDDGEYYYQYWCPYGGRKRHGVKNPAASSFLGCGKLHIDGRFADRLVKQMVIARLSDPRHADQLNRRAARDEAERARINAEIAEAEATDDMMLAKVGRGEMTEAKYETFGAPYRARMARLRAELAAIGAVENTLDVEDVAERWEESERLGRPEMRRRLVTRAYPRLALLPAVSGRPGVGAPERFDWDGLHLPTHE